MIQVADGNIMKDSTVVLTPVRTPLEIFGSLLKLWCPSRGTGVYTNSANFFSDLAPSFFAASFGGTTVTTTAGSNNITASAAGISVGMRLRINGVDRWVKSGSGVNFVLDSSWMNEGVFPSSNVNIIFYRLFPLQLNDKSGLGNNLTTTNVLRIMKDSKNKIFLEAEGGSRSMGMPLNILNNASKFIFGIKCTLNVTSTQQYITQTRNNGNSANRFSVIVQLVSNKTVFTIGWDQGSGQNYNNTFEVANSSNFTIVLFFDFPSQKIYIKINNNYYIQSLPTTQSIPNNNAAFANIFGSTTTNSGDKYLEPVIAVGSSLTLANMNELFDYYTYL